MSSEKLSKSSTRKGVTKPVVDSSPVRLSDLINVYESDCTLPCGDKLKIKPITTGQLKTLLVYEHETNPIIIEDALDNIISSSVTTPEFDIDNLTLQDRMDLMLELRRISKGSMYTFTHTCDSCKNESIVTKDLNTLVKQPVRETELTLQLNDRSSIVIGFPTRGDQKKAYLYQGVYEEDVEMDSTKMMDIATTTMAYAIKDVLIDGNSMESYQGDGELDEKIYMLENIPRYTFEKLTKFYEDNRYGTEFNFDFNCVHCGKKFSMVLPINDFFV